LLAQHVGEAIACVQQRQNVLHTLTARQRTVFLVSAEQSAIQIRRFSFTEGYLAAIRANTRPAEPLVVLASKRWDLAITAQRDEATLAFAALFAGIQNDADWTRRFDTDMSVFAHEY
jgi:hypothetical protein